MLQTFTPLARCWRFVGACIDAQMHIKPGFHATLCRNIFRLSQAKYCGVTVTRVYVVTVTMCDCHVLRRTANVPTTNFDRITAAIQQMLEGDVPAWRQPWRTLRESGAATMPRNAITGHTYRGINTCILWSRQDIDMRYLTYRQAAQHGGHVRKGEHGTQICFWQKRLYTKRSESGEDETRNGLLMKLYTVFHVSQCEDLQLPKVTKVQPQPVPPTIHDVYGALEARVDHGGDRACYIPSLDRITMPRPEAFTSTDAYSATALHELTHWTGHESRLRREFGKRFGDQAYAAEELVAELGSAFLCASLGVNSALEHHASYVHHWQKLLKSDPRAVVTAASKAQAAADYVIEKMTPSETAAEAADLEPAEAA
jgi:antirestriction protein ArdC